MTLTRTSALLVLLTSACASQQLPQQQLVDTNAAIDSAREIDKGETPSVELHVKFARDQITLAKKYMEDGEDEKAARMLDRAQADAEVALAQARTQESRQEATEAWNEVAELQNN